MGLYDWKVWLLFLITEPCMGLLLFGLITASIVLVYKISKRIKHI